jgi:hypothetical protein
MAWSNEYPEKLLFQSQLVSESGSFICVDPEFAMRISQCCLSANQDRCYGRREIYP